MVPTDCNIILVGHSIGCYMILSLMEILSGKRARTKFEHFNPPLSSTSPTFTNPHLLSRISKCIFLFPTVERMKDSPNGKRLWPILRYMKSLVVSLITVISWFPINLRTKLASWILRKKCVDENMIKPTFDLLSPIFFGNMMHLAYDELRNVKSLHIEAVKFFKSKLVFYFGVTDGWCPLSYRNELVKEIPDVVNYVDEHNIEHAFVLSHSHIMAKTLAKMLA